VVVRDLDGNFVTGWGLTTEGQLQHVTTNRIAGRRLMLQEEREALAPYLTLIRDFVGGRITAAAFDERYQERYLADARSWSEATFEILDRLFADVDFFVEDDDLRESGKGDLDAAGLIEAARRALDGLSALTQGR
jgi:hypothetical protein